MATVLMRWLEQRPQDYDRGIHLLTLGKAAELQEQFAEAYIKPGDQILEIGCGTGNFSIALAEQGAQVRGIDIAPAMLAEAERKADQISNRELLRFRLLDATQIKDEFQAQAFDWVVSSLGFSEMDPDTRSLVLQQAHGLLKPTGRIVILDEVDPGPRRIRIGVKILQAPLRLFTWLLTRTTTHTLRDFPLELERNGFQLQKQSDALMGTLGLYIAKPGELILVDQAKPLVMGRLCHQVTLRTRLLDLWCLFFRILPPYPKIKPGLYSIGEPGRDSPVLATCNFDLTIRRLVRELDRKVDTWLLVVDSAGINVWCAAGGGFLNAERVIRQIQSCRLEDGVDHRELILPQLSANGVDGWGIRRKLGWQVHWGPIRATDLPAYLAAGREKEEAARLVKFPLKDRLEMASVSLGLYALLILIPVLIFWRDAFWAVIFSLVGVAYVYAVTFPYLPGRDGLAKAIPLTLLVLLGMFTYTLVFDPVTGRNLFNRTIIFTALSIFVAAEFQGMAPTQRGEQANWGYEVLAAGVLGLIYLLVPFVAGWR